MARGLERAMDQVLRQIVHKILLLWLRCKLIGCTAVTTDVLLLGSLIIDIIWRLVAIIGGLMAMAMVVLGMVVDFTAVGTLFIVFRLL